MLLHFSGSIPVLSDLFVTSIVYELTLMHFSWSCHRQGGSAKQRLEFLHLTLELKLPQKILSCFFYADFNFTLFLNPTFALSFAQGVGNSGGMLLGEIKTHG